MGVLSNTSRSGSVSCMSWPTKISVSPVRLPVRPSCRTCPNLDLIQSLLSKSSPGRVSALSLDSLSPASEAAPGGFMTFQGLAEANDGPLCRPTGLDALIFRCPRGIPISRKTGPYTIAL